MSLINGAGHIQTLQKNGLKRYNGGILGVLIDIVFVVVMVVCSVEAYKGIRELD